MLEELIVHNYALIDQLNIRFFAGLNVLTGETGAGKSILIGALGLILGLKADTETIRSGADEMVISGVVRVADNPDALNWLEAHGLKVEDSSIIIRRLVKKSGRGSVFVQSSPFTLSDLRELAGFLFDMHGQHEHQSLLNLENHRKLLDRYGGCEDLAGVFYSLYTRLLKLREKYSGLIAKEQERSRMIDLLEFSIKEIQDAKLKIGEDEEIEKELKILSNYEKLSHCLEEVYNGTAESRGGALTFLRKARASMSEVLRIDPGQKELSNQLDSAFYEIEDFVESIGHYRSSIDYNPARLESLEERLALIRKLKKKYGNTIGEVLKHSAHCHEELKRIENWEEDKKNCEAEITFVEKELRQKAETLSGMRHKAAEKLQIRIEEELIHLGMPKVRFKVHTQDKENESGKPVYTPYGKDKVEFMISPNLGEPFKRLAQIASGGEISRIMLAIKSILVESDHINALIFDEVDVGIGGEVALSVGERLKTLSALKQILCITHLATIAVRADNHIKVEKVNKQNRTVTLAERITGRKRQEEIARMLSGDKRGETSLMHADELLKKYGT